MNTSKSVHASTKVVITFGFGSIFLLIGIVMWVAMATLHNVNTDMARLIADTDGKSERAYKMRDFIRLRSENVRSLQQVADPENREIVFEKLVNLTENYNKSRRELVALGANEREQEILSKISLGDARVSEVYTRANDIIYNMIDSPDSLKSVLNDLQLQELVLLKQLNDLVELEKTIAEEALQQNQERFRTTLGTLTAIALVALALGIIISIVVINRVARANSRIAHLASHDDLTGLFNRREFEARLSAVMKAAASGSTPVYGLLYLDLDRFKIVNDTCGHHAGDQLLIKLTELFSSKLRRTDVLGRLGGDEFAVIASADSFDEITQLAEQLRVAVQDFVFHYDQEEFTVSLSIGVIPISEETDDIETLLTHVDSACYVAKQSGRNRVHVAQKNDQEVLRYRSDLAGVQNIRSALSDERFELYYQPVFKINEHDTTLEHCEVLLRIKDDEGNVYSPADFIPLAEKYNLMIDIDRWVVKNVLTWIETWQDQMQLPRLLVNLSGLSYMDDEFLIFLIAALEKADIDYTRLAFEITETAAVDDVKKALHFIHRIREFGCRFALDDFGSGFSTFAYLKNLPIEYLKIDGTLVMNMQNDNVDREMVRAINQVGHIVGAKTIAEFVENDEILQELRLLGVDYAQGYGLQRPAPIATLPSTLGHELGNQDGESDDHGYTKAA